MTTRAALPGTFADLRTVKTRSVVQMIIEFPIERGADVVAMFGFPQPGQEVPVAVARLNVAPQIEHAAPAGEKKRWALLPPAQQAAIRCGEPAFRRFLAETGDFSGIAVLDLDMAAEEVRERCGVRSRAQILPGTNAAAIWATIDARFQNWMRVPA